MPDSIFQNVSRQAKMIIAGVLLFPLIILLAIMAFGGFFQAAPWDPPMVVGCYVAAGAPALHILHDSIDIIEPARRKFTYEIYRPRDSYLLRVRPALMLERQASGRYAFVERRGVGYFWSLRPEIGKSSGKVRDAKDYAGRIELVADDATIIYSRVSNNSACHL